MKLINLTPDERVGDPIKLCGSLKSLAYRIAEKIRATGGQRKLRDMTINLPVDHEAISVIELACQALSQGEFSEEAAELDMVLERMAADATMGLRLGPAMRNMAERILPDGFL